MRPEQEALLTALAGDSQKVRLFLPLGAASDAILGRLSAEFYVRVVSSEYGSPRALSDEELEQLLV